jgi:RimJ/RimL family protein N-acetyltransferase
VVEAARRRGVYVALLRAVCRGVGDPDARVVAHTDIRNLASRAGLEKASFKCDREVRIVIVASFVAWVCKVRSATGTTADAGTPAP